MMLARFAIALLVGATVTTAAVAESPLTADICFSPENARVVLPDGSGRVETRRGERGEIVVTLVGPAAFACAVPQPIGEGRDMFHFRGSIRAAYFGHGRHKELGGGVMGLFPMLPPDPTLADLATLADPRRQRLSVFRTALHLSPAFVGRIRNVGSGHPGDVNVESYVGTNLDGRDLRPTLIALCPWPGETVEVTVRNFSYVDDKGPK